VARAAGRRREIAVRLAIGASPLHVVRQLLAESALLWLIAGSLGTALAALVVRLLAALPLPTDRPLFLDLEVDARVLAFSFAATALTGLAFGLVPALAVARADLVQALKDGAGRGVGFRSPLRLALLAGQVALSVVLLVGGSLCLRSLANAHSIDLGFEPDGVLMASLDLELQGYDERAARSFWSGLLERLAALPQVEAVGLSNRVPFQLNLIRLPVSAHGRDGRGLPSVDTAIVDAGYFDALRVPIRAGRGFGPLSDAPRATAEVVINENLARRLWPGEEALGRKLRVGGGLHEVVGVAKDGRYFTLGEEPTPFLYLRFARTPSAMTVLVRSSLGSARPSVIADLRRAVADLDKALPLFDAKSLHEHLGVALLPARVSAGVLGWFGALALLLVSVGLHGLLSHAVTLRTHEIGVRRALGARDADVVRLVVGQALLPVLAGVALGLGVAFALSPVLRALLYGIAPGDPAANALAAAALLFTAAVASSLPALRAARLEPMAALRRE
jgi:predicted permease